MSIAGAFSQLQLEQVIQKILEYRVDQRISAESLLTTIQAIDPSILAVKSPEYGNLTPLWFLAVIATEFDNTQHYEKRASAIEQVLEKWSIIFSCSDFVVAPNDELRKNRTIAWLLAAAAYKAIAPRAFHLFWAQWGNVLNLNALLMTDVEGISPLWWLAKAVKQNDNLFRDVWKKWGKKLLPEELGKKPTGEYDGQSLQWLIIDGAQTNENLRPIVEEILAHFPEVLSDEDVVYRPQGEASIADKLKIAGDWGGKIQAWIESRNHFFRTLRHSKAKKEIDSTTSLELLYLAEKAFLAGYIEAFHDLYEFYEQRTENASPMLLIDELDEDYDYSINHVRAYICASKSWLRVGMNQSFNQKERRLCLENALTYAVKVPITSPNCQLPSRSHLLSTIACCYISEGASVQLERSLPPKLLKRMSNTPSVRKLLLLCAEASETYKLAECTATLQGRIIDLEVSLLRMQIQGNNHRSPVVATSDFFSYTPYFTLEAASALATEPPLFYR